MSVVPDKFRTTTYSAGQEDSVYLTSPVDQAGRGFFFTRRQSTQGGYDVREAFGEIIVPLLTDLPL